MPRDVAPDSTVQCARRADFAGGASIVCFAIGRFCALAATALDGVELRPCVFTVAKNSMTMTAPIAAPMVRPIFELPPCAGRALHALTTGSQGQLAYLKRRER
jgi:hypothetical protein